MNPQQKTIEKATQKSELITKLCYLLQAQSFEQQAFCADFKFWAKHVEAFTVPKLKKTISTHEKLNKIREKYLI